MTLPAAYVAEHIELGYASTVRRAQGLTVDTAHAVIDNSATRELLYVAMTRGAQANHVYITTSTDDEHVPHEPAKMVGDRLREVLARVGAEPTTTETLRLAISEHASLATLIHEYETIAAHAVAIGIARLPRHDIPHRTPIAGLITILVGRLPEDYAAALRQREAAITAAAREAVEAATSAQEEWTRRTPVRALEMAAVYRAKYAVTDPDSIGAPPEGDRAQARDYQLIRRKVLTPPAAPARRTSAPTSFFGPTR